MLGGVHSGYHWQLAQGELRVASPDARVGFLKAHPAPTAASNAEQAQWFAQGRIDINGDELATQSGR